MNDNNMSYSEVIIFCSLKDFIPHYQAQPWSWSLLAEQLMEMYRLYIQFGILVTHKNREHMAEKLLHPHPPSSTFIFSKNTLWITD